MKPLNYYFLDYNLIPSTDYFPRQSFEEFNKEDISIVIFFKERSEFLEIKSKKPPIRRKPEVTIRIFEDPTDYSGDENYNLIVKTNKDFENFIKQMKIEDLEILKFPDPDKLDSTLALLTYWASTPQNGDYYVTLPM